MNMLIGLTGPAGSGKSYCAEYLVQQFQYKRVRFAAPLKAMLRAGLESAGLSPIHAEDMVDGFLKESPADILSGNTPRHAMQTLGTEWGRECLGEDFWVGIARAQIEKLLRRGCRVVLDDARFQNEANMISALGGDVVRVTGRKKDLGGAHPSESGDAVHTLQVNNAPGNDVAAELCALHDYKRSAVFS